MINGLACVLAVLLVIFWPFLFLVPYLIKIADSRIGSMILDLAVDVIKRILDAFQKVTDAWRRTKVTPSNSEKRFFIKRPPPKQYGEPD